jgi:arylsulfatase A-like enzyme
MEGRSFWKLLTGEERVGGHDRVISLECTFQAKWSLRTDRYKYILAREPDFYGNPARELYDLVADPKEERNVAGDRPAVAAAMEAELEGWIAERLQQLGRDQDPLREHGVSLKGASAARA